jgi:type II secretory pathway predicted ATPase ExeA
MTNMDLRGKPKAAMLSNVTALLEMVEALKNRETHLPGMGCLFAPAGFGKSTACAVAAAEGDAVYVECKGTWTRKYFLEATCYELGIQPSRKDAEMATNIGRELAQSDRYLLIDEADILVDKGKIDIAREIHMNSLQPVILIGEEALQNKLKAYDRVHGRIHKWHAGTPTTLADGRQLVSLYLDGLQVADDLLSLILQKRKGVIRRVVSNLDEVRIQALRDDVQTATLEWWEPGRIAKM